ncbi:hypothetical protein CZ794_12295 [Psychrobacter sp. JB385]|nr:hypothetical protein CZ794_12295 [Psychrobacter sp. JB385]
MPQVKIPEAFIFQCIQRVAKLFLLINKAPFVAGVFSSNFCFQ